MFRHKTKLLYSTFPLQLTVFRVLFEQWTAFCEFRDGITDDKILPIIERHKRKAKQQKKNQKQIGAKKEKVQNDITAVEISLEIRLTNKPISSINHSGNGRNFQWNYHTLPKCIFAFNVLITVPKLCLYGYYCNTSFWYKFNFTPHFLMQYLDLFWIF